jgi:energy-coupling factor transport system permease protein
MFHTWSWVVWLAAAAVAAFTLHNPLYLALVLGAAWIVYTALGRSTPIGSSWGAFVKLGLFFLVLTVLFNALSIHIGQIILFRLPEGWPIIGGPITLEAIIAGAVLGLSLLTILMVFAAFNAVVDHYQLLRVTPAFLFQAGVVISIAITFVPQMVLSAKEIRQAQRIRGHRFRGIRDLLPLIMPLLASSLERAIQLAETMEARGFGSMVAPLSRRQAMVVQVSLLLGLVGLVAGLFVATYFSDWRVWGWMMVVLAVALMLGVFWFQGRQVQRSHYRRQQWRWRDIAIAVSSAIVVAAILVARLVAPETLYYSPYPPNSLLPPFAPLLGAALLLLTVPALVAPRTTEYATPSTENAV